MAEDRKVSFARINRRDDRPGQQGQLDPRSFTTDMVAMAHSRDIVAKRPHPQGERTWIAADIEVTGDEEFIFGLIGFQTVETQYPFEPESHSWTKERRGGPAVGSDRTLVPFAVDIRPDRRWVAFTTTQKVTRSAFANAFQEALNQAVAALHLFPTVWEVDLVTSPTTIERWLAEHPDVVVIKRIVKLPNPVRDLSGMYAEMRDLNAHRTTQEHAAAPGEVLDVHGPSTLSQLTEGVQQGNVALTITSRGEGRARPRFSTSVGSDTAFIEDFGDDLETGKERVLRALTHYSSMVAGEDADQADEDLIIEEQEILEP